MKGVALYYANDPDADSVDIELLERKLKTKAPAQAEKFVALFDALPAPSPSNMIEYLVEQRLFSLGAKLTQLIAANKFEEAAELSGQYQEVQQMGIVRAEDKDELFNVYQGAHISELTEALREGGGYTLLPGILDEIVFNLMPGDHIGVFGQVNRGKSAFGIQIACDFAADGHTVLYLGNEDPAQRMILRIICNFCGVPLEEVQEDEDRYTDIALEEGYGNIIFKRLSPGTVADVVRLCKHFKPSVCVVDQARNLVPDKKSEGAAKQEAIFYGLRMLYGAEGIIGVSLTQAGEKDIHGKPLENKVRLEQNDVYESKSGVASQLDVMIGIGATPAMLEGGQLCLNVCKNKASGIHESVDVRIDRFTSRIIA